MEREARNGQRPLLRPTQATGNNSHLLTGDSVLLASRLNHGMAETERLAVARNHSLELKVGSKLQLKCLFDVVRTRNTVKNVMSDRPNLVAVTFLLRV